MLVKDSRYARSVAVAAVALWPIDDVAKMIIPQQKGNGGEEGHLCHIRPHTTHQTEKEMVGTYGARRDRSQVTIIVCNPGEPEASVNIVIQLYASRAFFMKDFPIPVR